MIKRIIHGLIIGWILLIVGSLPSASTMATFAQPMDPPARLQRVPAPPEGTLLHLPPLASSLFEDNQPRFVFVRMQGPPLAAVYAAQKTQGRGLMSARQQQAYVQQLTLAQQQLIPQIENLGIPVISRYQKVLNGLQVKARPAQFPALLALPSVVAIHPITPMAPLLKDSVPHIGAQRVMDELGIDGTGIQIGIIDTGVDYIHADFGGPATEDAYAANNPTIITDLYDGTPLFPTAKVVGGWDFAGRLYDAGCSEEEEAAGVCSSIPLPDPDPFDENGHGTHVAGIAGGIGTDTVPHGVAPGASLWALKVFGEQGSTTLVPDALEWAVDPNGDGDLSDALDVLNLSVGAIFAGGKTATDAAEEMAIANAVAAGTAVVAAAGNDGDVPLIVNSPSTIPAAISVASSYPPGEEEFAIEVVAPPSIAGRYPALEAAEDFTPRLADIGEIEGELAYVGRGCPAGAGDPPLEEPDPYLADPSGKIALIDRGLCFFSDKIRRAEEAGAIAVIVTDNREGPLVRMVGVGEPVGIPAVFISKQSGDTIKAGFEEGTVIVRLGPDITIPHPELTDQIAESSSRGPGWRRRFGSLDPENPPSILKPEITAPGVNIVSALAGSGNDILMISGTSMSTPHVAGVAALVQQAHPDWTPQQVKAALLTTAHPQIYLDGNPEFGGGGTIVPVTRMGAGLVDAFAAVSTDVLVLGGTHEPVVDFGFQAIADPTQLARTLTLQNVGNTTHSYDVSFAFQDETEADAGVTIALSSNNVRIPAGQSATLQVTAQIDPAALKDWPLFGSATGSGDDLTDIEYSGLLTLTPTDDTSAPTLTVPVYLLPRKSANIQVNTSTVELQDFGVENGADLTLTNSSVVPGFAEIFTLAGTDPNEELPWDETDVRAVGVRNTPIEGLGNVLEFAFVTYAPRIHPYQFQAQIFIDINQDRTADYAVLNGDLGLLTGSGPSGVNVTVLVNLVTGAASLQFFTLTDLFSPSIDLAVLAEDMELGAGNLTFDFWAAIFDVSANLVDVVPDGAFATPARYTFDGANPLYVVDEVSVEVTDSSMIHVSADPKGALAQPTAEGLLILYDTSPTDEPYDIVQIDFEYEIREIAIEADRSGTGFVNNVDGGFSSLGGSPMWTGQTIGGARWHGVTQFNLTADLPSKALIVEAALDLTGLETKYLNENVDATWRVELLDESVDALWPDISYHLIRLAGVDATLIPTLQDDDLGAEVVNIFQFDKDQIALLSQRIATTGQASFRTTMELNPLYRFFTGRHLFAWDGGGDTRLPGNQPPVLRISFVAAK